VSWPILLAAARIQSGASGPECRRRYSNKAPVAGSTTALAEAGTRKGRVRVLCGCEGCVSSSRQFAPFFAVQGEQAQVRNDFVAGANSSSFRDGVVTVNGESNGLVELEKN
jgi:hypothetical protein